MLASVCSERNVNGWPGVAQIQWQWLITAVKAVQTLCGVYKLNRD